MYKNEEYERHQAFEHELINRRLTWLLSSQSILFAALALVLQDDVRIEFKEIFLKSISCLGIFIYAAIFVSICMGILAKYKNFEDEQKNRKDEVQWGVRTPITIVALIPDVLMPVGFALAWFFIKANFLDIIDSLSRSNS